MSTCYWSVRVTSFNLKLSGGLSGNAVALWPVTGNHDPRPSVIKSHLGLGFFSSVFSPYFKIIVIIIFNILTMEVGWLHLDML